MHVTDLHTRHPTLTQALGESLSEAAIVCLDRHHEPPVPMGIHCNSKWEVHEVRYSKPDVRTKRAYANETDTTELGAYAVSLAAVETLTGLVAVSRAETLTGADWYLSPGGAELIDLEAQVRIEISGTDRGDSNEIAQRLKKKLSQAAAGLSNLPALASVVGFKAKEVVIADLEVAGL
jgi:hypothetical protein